MSNRFDKYNYGFVNGNIYNFKDKGKCVNNHISYMLNRTQSMFKYEGLPHTLSKRMIELYLQTNGHVCIYKHENELYALLGSFGGVPDVYYMPTQYVVANPALKLFKTLDIDKECVVIANDSLYMGLLPMSERYATMLTENELSMKIASVNSRITSLISASDDRTAKSAEKYLQDIENGEMGVIAENAFLDGVKSQPYGATANSNILTNLIELEQYIKASWFNELGLNANYNMKRESINSGESQLNDDMLLPLVDDMLECRKRGIEKINEMFGTNITVSLNSSWENNMEELEMEMELLSGQPENEELELEQLNEDEIEELKTDPEEVENEDEEPEVENND